MAILNYVAMAIALTAPMLCLGSERQAAPLTNSALKTLLGNSLPDATYQDTDVRTVIREIFRHVQVPYCINPEIQGKVSLRLHNLTFDAALDKVLHQVGASYRINSGVVQILYLGPIVAGPDPIDAIMSEAVSQDIQQEVLGDLLPELSRSSILDPRVHGKVTVIFKMVPREQALSALLHQVNAIQVQDGIVIRIIPAPVPKSSKSKAAKPKIER